MRFRLFTLRYSPTLGGFDDQALAADDYRQGGSVGPAEMGPPQGRARIRALASGAHRHFQIHDPKTRWISAAPYRDRVVHHALCNIIEPHLDRRFIHDCWANRTRKGTHRAVLRYQKFAGRYCYALKADIRRCFPSIDHLLLKQPFARRFQAPPTSIENGRDRGSRHGTRASPGVVSRR